MGILVGDVDGSGTVDQADVQLTKRATGDPVSFTNFRADVTAFDVNIDQQDVRVVKGHVGNSLPSQ